MPENVFVFLLYQIKGICKGHSEQNGRAQCKTTIIFLNDLVIGTLTSGLQLTGAVNQGPAGHFQLLK